MKANAAVDNFTMRISPEDKKKLAELAEHNQVSQAKLILGWVREWHARITAADQGKQSGTGQQSA